MTLQDIALVALICGAVALTCVAGLCAVALAVALARGFDL